MKMRNGIKPDPKKPNYDVKLRVYNSSIYAWQVAERWGVSEQTYMCRMRRELDANTKKQLMDIIDELEKEEKDAAAE